MDCAAMSLTASPLSSRYGFSLEHCTTGRLHDDHPRHQHLSFVQMRVNYRSEPTSFHKLGRGSGYGVTVSKTLISWRSTVGASSGEKSVGVEEIECENDEGDAWLVDEATTPFNQISVLELHEAADHELAGAYVLKLDSADLAHSVFWSNGKVWSGGCHDVFASLPPLLPEGPVGILGLGAGTVARLLLHIWLPCTWKAGSLTLKWCASVGNTLDSRTWNLLKMQRMLQKPSRKLKKPKFCRRSREGRRQGDWLCT